MRAAGAGSVDLVLPADGGVSRDAGAAAATGRAVHADTVLRGAADDGLAAEPGASRQPKAGAAPAPTPRGRGNLPETCDEHPDTGPPDLSLPATWRADHPRRPGQEHRHHLHPPGARLDLPGCDPGLVQRSEEHTSELQSRPHLVCRLL